jgi:hypothetical protein
MSNINTNAIDTTYPVPGVNNTTQGFRDNFTSIKTNLNTTKTEIDDIQSKSIVKAALDGTTLNNNMANTLISNAAVQGFRAKTYNLGAIASGTLLINVTRADVQYGTIYANTEITFGGWPPSGTQSNLQLYLTVANSSASVTFPNTTVDGSGNITTGMSATARLLENYYSNGAATANTIYTNIVTVPAGVNQLNYNLTTIDCGTILDIEPTNRNQKAAQIPVRTPTSIGVQGDAPGQICVDSQFMYLCVGTYNGTAGIWGKVALSAI